jgi:DNA polymerase-3 subunit epsilon
MDLTKEQFVCIDCEMTGLDKEQDRIIEVAVAKFTFDGIHDQFEELIDPEMMIPQTSISIHHITQEMVEGKPKIQEILPSLLSFVGRATIVGHGVGFDVELIHTSAKRHGINSTINSNPIIDTLRLARLYGESPVNSLERLRQHFNIGEEGAHRAMNDVVVNISVFKHLAKRYNSTQELLKVLSKPILMKTMPLGKHKGRLLKEIPLEYLLWAARKDFDQDLLFSLRQEINRRKKGGHFSEASNPFSFLD